MLQTVKGILSERRLIERTVYYKMKKKLYLSKEQRVFMCVAWQEENYKENAAVQTCSCYVSLDLKYSYQHVFVFKPLLIFWTAERSNSSEIYFQAWVSFIQFAFVYRIELVYSCNCSFTWRMCSGMLECPSVTTLVYNMISLNLPGKRVCITANLKFL
jgi:hypothetical protein